MGAKDMARLATLLRKLASPRDPPPGLVEERPDLLTRGGVADDLYAPRGKAAGAVVAVHGAVVTGRKDARLRHMARCVAASGVACAVPTLPGLARMELDPADVVAIEGIVEELHADLGPVRLAGFSYGASYSLVAAARPKTAPRVRFALAVGPVRSFAELYDSYYETRDEPLKEGARADGTIYLRMAMAYRQRDHVGLDAGMRRSLEEILARYCSASSAEEKRAFHDRWLAGARLSEIDYERRNPDALEAISPAGKLGGLRCRVGLIHDRGDHLVPVSHSERLHAELLSLPDPRGHRLHVTSLLTHVSPTRLPGLGDAIGLARILYPLMAAS